MRKTLFAITILSLGLWAATPAKSVSGKLPSEIRNPKSEIQNAGTDAITIPRLLSYQGKLTDTAGHPVPNGNYSITYRLYTVPSGGTAFWSEVQSSVPVKSGLFAVLLGSVTPIAGVPDAGAMYLGMQVGASELTPRVRIVSAAYAYKADTANYALAAPSGGDPGWVHGGDSVLYTIRRLGIARGGSGNVLRGTGRFTHVNLGVACTTGTATYNDSFNTVSGGYGNRAYGQWGGYATVGGGYSNLATSDHATVAGGEDDAADGDHATVGGGCSNTASGSYATVGGGYYDVATGDNATVAGGDENEARGSHATVGGGHYDVATGDDATVGGGAENEASVFAATVGGGFVNQACGGCWATVGGGFYNTASESCATVAGGSHNLADYPNATVAGGDSNWSDDTCTAVGGGYGNVAYQQYATVPGGRCDSARANYSFATGYSALVRGGDDYSAAFTQSHTIAANQVRAAAFSTGYEAFSVDHPAAPLTKILNQYAVGSPELVLLYRGTATIGSDGRAEVRLPDYFDQMNRNPMVQLTGVGTPEPVYVAEDVTGNRFVIGGKPGTKVYWTVTGERKDLAADMARIFTPVEQEKTGELSGHSLDDDALCGYMAGLEKLGLGGNYSFRTADGRRQYEMTGGRLGGSDNGQENKPKQPNRPALRTHHERKQPPTSKLERGTSE